MLLLILLVLLRVPSIAQPAGGDQLLYSYVGQRILDGDVPYRDAFEQKPPGVLFAYAGMWALWSHESVVAAADLAAAIAVAMILIALGRSMFGGRTGEGAAVLFLVLGDPAIQRLAGMNVRAQGETFIAVAVAGAILLAWRPPGSRWRLVAAGALGGLAFWVKYNAVVCLAPITLAALSNREGRGQGTEDTVRDVAALIAGAGIVSAGFLAYFAATGALPDLWAGTVEYNLRYSGETYRSIGHVTQYVTGLPFERGRVDGLWFVGGLGMLGTFLLAPRSTAARLTLAWIAAAIASIAINGSRGLPQYFVQAAPALALAGAAGLALAFRARRRSSWRRVTWPALVALAAAGFFRVGFEPGPYWQPRAFGVPQLLSNVRFDLRYASGRVERDDYLRRFGREAQSKFSPLLVERLAMHAKTAAAVDEPVYVFGFASGGVYVKSERRSASRFFWSRPVVLDFARDRPDFGPAGLLDELTDANPALVALQKQDWGLAEPDVPNSRDFFLSDPGLRAWLESRYVPDYEDEQFEVWKRRN